MKKALWLVSFITASAIAHHRHTRSYRRIIKPSKQLFDLQALAQSFVLETKQLRIPQFSGAFNPSITHWNNHFLLSFRLRDKEMVSTFGIGLIWLDNDFNPIGDPYILEIESNRNKLFAYGQDPRLITKEDKLFIVYNNFNKIGQHIRRRMVIAEVFFENNRFFTAHPRQLHSFQETSNKPEKNWVPFVYQDKLLLAYSLLPHHILQPDYISGDCPTLCNTYSNIQWNWGILRGGTPAVRLNDQEYLAFFHSSKPFASVQSHGKIIVHYMMGAYTFQAEPPFAITRISQKPIVGPHFYDGPLYTTWKPLRVVFPMGCIIDNDFIWVTYGKQDFEMWIAKFDKQKLLKSLIPVQHIA